MIIGISGKQNSGKDTIGKIIQFLTSHEYKDGWRNYENWLDSIYEPTFNSNWKIKKFADKLKDVVCLLINCTRKQLEDREFKEKELGEEWWYYKYGESLYNYKTEKTLLVRVMNSEFLEPCAEEDLENCLIKLTPRLLLQLLGTECGREILHPNLWVNSLFADYKSYDKGKAHDLKDLSELYTHKECKNCKKSYSGWKRQYLCKECIEDKSIQFYPNWIITDCRFPNEAQAIKERGGILIRIERPGLAESNHLSETSLDSATFDFIIDNDKDIEHLIDEVRKILKKLSII